MTAAQPSLMRRLRGVMFKLPLMITCEEFEGFIIDYLTGALTPKQKFVFELHLKVCRECRDYLSAYEAAMALAKDITTQQNRALEEPPEDLVRAVLAAISGNSS